MTTKSYSSCFTTIGLCQVMWSATLLTIVVTHCCPLAWCTPVPKPLGSIVISLTSKEVFFWVQRLSWCWLVCVEPKKNATQVTMIETSATNGTLWRLWWYCFAKISFALINQHHCHRAQANCIYHQLSIFERVGTVSRYAKHGQPNRLMSNHIPPNTNRTGSLSISKENTLS